jgi:hypothetical protein
MFDFATRDLSLAIAHHLLIFLLAGVLAFEIGVIRSSMKREDILRIASVDNWYGISRPGDSRGRFLARDLRREGMGLLPGQRILLGQDCGFYRGCPAFGHSDDTDHSLAPDTEERHLLPPGRAGHRRRQTLSVGRGGGLCLHPGLRRRNGPRLWRSRALMAVSQPMCLVGHERLGRFKSRYTIYR